MPAGGGELGLVEAGGDLTGEAGQDDRVLRGAAGEEVGRGLGAVRSDDHLGELDDVAVELGGAVVTLLADRGVVVELGLMGLVVGDHGCLGGLQLGAQDAHEDGDVGRRLGLLEVALDDGVEGLGDAVGMGLDGDDAVGALLPAILCLPSGSLLPGVRQLRRHMDALRRKRDNLVTAMSFLSPQVATDRFDVVIELASVVVANGTNFLNDGVFPHDHSSMSSSGVQSTTGS